MSELAGIVAGQPLLFHITAFVLGLLVGSFLNVVIHRLPARLQADWRNQCREVLGTSSEVTQDSAPGLVTPRSRCPHCGHAISALENIPILSYMFLRGRCSACDAPIALRYPLVEALTGLLSVAIAVHFGPGWECTAALLLTWSLITLTFIDYDHQLLPDVITLPLLWLGLLCNSAGLFTDLGSAVYGAIAGYLSLWLVYQGFLLLTGKEGMGYGDFKLLAALGAWLGWQLLPVTILLAALTGSLLGIIAILFLGRERARPLPFGPYLAVAGWVALMWGEDITVAYLRYAGTGG